MLHHAFQSFTSDKAGRTVLFQRPNAPLIACLAAAVLSRLVAAGTVQDMLRLVACTSLAYWAVAELFHGASPFRRTLGVLALLGLTLIVWR